MFGLLKAAWQSESADKRLQAIQKMDASDAANQTILLNLASSDSESNVRHSAISQLNSPSDIFNISQTHADESTRSFAESALHQLIGAKSSLTEEQFQQLLSNHSELKIPIAKFCPNSNIRLEILKTLSHSEQVDIIADIEYSETRQLIAEKLTDISALERARSLLKGKDKRAEKIIRTKLQEHQIIQKQEEENYSVTLEICEKMEYVASHSSHQDFQAMFNIWSQRWESLKSIPDEELSNRYQKAFNQAKKDISTQEKLNALRDNQQVLLNGLKKYCQKTASLSWQALCSESDNINKTIEQSETIWLELIAASSNESTVQQDQLNLMQNALSSLALLSNIPFTQPFEISNIKTLKHAISAVSWPNTLPKLQSLEDAKNKLADIEKISKQNAIESSAKLDQLHKRINRLLGSTKRGSLGQAKRELAAVTKATSQFSGKDKASLEERLKKAEEEFSKMGDWKDFASEPKFLALCESMEKLINSDIHPDALATKISKLQNSWKSLGYADSADDHWERFKTAADKAYEPCAEFFAQRHKKRERNLEKREPLVTQMQGLHENTDWENIIDYKPIESELNNILHAWKKIKDVERDAGQQQWNRLAVFKSAVYEKLDLIYDENIESKNQLIEQAKNLLDFDVKDDTLNKLKLFQSRWKQVGITRRKQDRVAWKDFKAATDAVYEKIQATRKSKRAEEDVHLAGYREITKKIRQLGKKQSNLNAADKTFEQLQADYQALPSLPKNLADKLAERLNNDFKQACDVYNNARNGLKESEYQQAVDALSKKAVLCSELEQSHSPEDIERLKNALDAIEIPNNELKRRFDDRLNNAQQTDRSNANQARQRLCLDLEILLDVESPPEEKALRMQVQLERMKGQGLGHAVKDPKTAIKDFKLDWLCLPGADPKLQKNLEKRFQNAIKNTTLL